MGLKCFLTNFRVGCDTYVVYIGHSVVRLKRCEFLLKWVSSIFKELLQSGSLVLQSSANSARLGILEFLCGAVISM